MYIGLFLMYIGLLQGSVGCTPGWYMDFWCECKALLGVYEAHANEIHLKTQREVQWSLMSVRHSSFG